MTEEVPPTDQRVSITRLSSPRAVRDELIEDLPEGLVLEVELGSGSSRKTRLLLEAMHEHGEGDRYVPLDISEDAVRAAADTLAADYPWLEVHGLVSDFHADLASLSATGPRLVAFLGSTMGNLTRGERAGLLHAIAAMLAPEDRLLLGTDLVKQPEVLIAAYDDAAGVTAAFNRNMLAVVGDLLGVELPVEAFAHEARWNPAEERIEMWLVARAPVTLDLVPAGMRLTLEAGEGLRTELSCKFRREGLEAELSAAGLTLERWMTDEGNRFGLSLIARA